MISEDRKNALLEANKEVLDQIQHRYRTQTEKTNPVQNGGVTTWTHKLPNVDDLFAKLHFEQHSVSV